MDAPCALIPVTVEKAALARERFSENEAMTRITHECLVGLHEQLKADEDAAIDGQRFEDHELMLRLTFDRLVSVRDLFYSKFQTHLLARRAHSSDEHRLSSKISHALGFHRHGSHKYAARRSLSKQSKSLQQTESEQTRGSLDSRSTSQVGRAAVKDLQAVVRRYFDCRPTFSKTSVFIYRMACERRLFNELHAIHKDLDHVVELAELDDLKKASWEAELRAARAEEEGAMMIYARKQTLPFVRNVKGHEAMEALTLMKFEIDYYPPPENSKDHVAAMKIVFFSIVRSSNGRVSKIPDWYSPPYLFIYDRAQPISESNVVATTFRGRYADRKVAGSPAVDVIVKRMEINADGIESFCREAEQWFNMKCPHVVKLLAASHRSAPALLVLEEEKGMTLKQYLSMPEHRHELWSKYREAAEGLKYLRFEERTVHGNIKPNNILVDAEGTVKVTDFGRGIATLQNLAILVGNGESYLRWRAPEYRSPDQRPTYMNDMYSLGLCILDTLVPNFEPPRDGQLQRPNGIKDDAWSLIAQMCVLKPTDRIDLSEVIEKLKLLDKASVKVLVRNIPSELDIPGNSIQITPISSVTIQRNHIGKGSHACIHLADWKGAKVVAKCVPIKSVADKQAFDREMSIWRKVQPHPHVLPLYGISESDSQCIAFCEFAAGECLDKYLSKNRRIRIWQKLLQAALAVMHFHAYFVIHNDIKCNNFMVRGDGQVMIGDFDLSFIVNEPPPQVANLNPRWRAPECIVEGGAGPSFASDVYSLGMSILEAITGEVPWGRLLDPAIRYHLKKQTPLKRPSTITDTEWELVSAMIKYEPEERITLDDVVQRLQQLADAEEFPSTQTS